MAIGYKGYNILKNLNGFRIVVIIALLIRLAVTIVAHPWSDPLLLDDDQSYFKMGNYFAETGSLSFENVVPEIYSTIRTPGYPVFLSVIDGFFGPRMLAIVIIQIILDIISLVLIFNISILLFNSERYALIASLLYALNITSILYTQLIMTEILFITLMLFSFFFFLKGTIGQKWIHYVISGFVLSIAAYVRPIVILYPVLMIIIISLHKISLQRKLLYSFILLSVFYLFISPWQYRNYIKYGYYQMSSIGGYTLANYDVAIARSKTENLSTKIIVEQNLKEVENIKNPFEKSAHLQKNAFKYILSNPFNYAKYHLEGCMNLYLSTDKEMVLKLLGIERKTSAISNGYESLAARVKRNLFSPEEYFMTPILAGMNFLLYLTAIIGVIRVFTSMRSNINSLWLLLLSIAYFTILTGTVGGARYRLPAEPFYIILSSVGISAILDSLLTKYKIFRKKTEPHIT